MLKKIIIIDDDAEDIEIMRESIQTLPGDYECKTFIDACEALEYLRNNASVPDLIVIDINMPYMNGHECLNEIRKISKLHPSSVAVYSSAVATKESIADFKKSGAVFFQKPSSYEALSRIFNQLIYTSSQRSQEGEGDRRNV